MVSRFDYLDALRGVAILGVILVHAAFLSQQEELLLLIGFTGQRGVQLFYMVSAFTLFLSLDSRAEEHGRWPNFFIRRFCRIAPMFYIAIIVNLLVNGRVVGENPRVLLSPTDILSGFVFLHGLSPKTINAVALGGWSIAVEASFYVLVPVLFLFVKTIRRAVLLFVLSAIILAPMSWRLAILPGNFQYQQYFTLLWFPIEFPVFCIGIITYLCWRQFISPALRSTTASHRRDLSGLLLLASAVLYLANFPFNDGSLYYSSFLFLPLILGLALHPWSLLVNRFTIFMGKISYSVYLLHFFGLIAAQRILHYIDNGPGHLVSQYVYTRPLGLIVGYAMILGMSLPVCALSWRFVEQPGIAFGKRWIASRNRRLESRRVTAALEIAAR